MDLLEFLFRWVEEKVNKDKKYKGGETMRVKVRSV